MDRRRHGLQVRELSRDLLAQRRHLLERRFVVVSAQPLEQVGLGAFIRLEVERVVLKVWESLDYICAERLTPSLLVMAQHLARFGVIELTPQIESQLSTISCSTVERMLRKNRSRKVRLPRKGPERANQVTKDVPMKRIPWDTQEPGHFEVDLVHHSGESTAGDYLHTLQLVDVATGRP